MSMPSRCTPLFITCMDQVKDIDERIEAERTRLHAERDAKDAALLAHKVGGLDMAHKRRINALETRLSEEMRSLKARQLKELEEVNIPVFRCRCLVHACIGPYRLQ